jgi:trehalose-phosphatase
MKELLQRIERGERVFLFLDYDGTLVPIQETPERALFPPAKRTILSRFSRSAFVGIVSGRSLCDIQRLIDITDIAYIGNHGLETSYGGNCWVHPEAERKRPILKDVLRNIHLSTKDIPGVLVEDKGVTGAVHYRLADPAFGELLNEIIKKEVERTGLTLKMTEGKKVFEIRPNVPWDKGKGLLKLMEWLDPEGRSRLIYIGDDRTDEDAFRAVNRFDRRGITVHVGRATRSQARYQLGNVSEVWIFLRTLLRVLTEFSGGKT